MRRGCEINWLFQCHLLELISDVYESIQNRKYYMINETLDAHCARLKTRVIQSHYSGLFVLICELDLIQSHFGYICDYAQF